MIQTPTAIHETAAEFVDALGKSEPTRVHLVTLTGNSVMGGTLLYSFASPELVNHYEMNTGDGNYVANRDSIDAGLTELSLGLVTGHVRQLVDGTRAHVFLPNRTGAKEGTWEAWRDTVNVLPLAAEVRYHERFGFVEVGSGIDRYVLQDARTDGFSNPEFVGTALDGPLSVSQSYQRADLAGDIGLLQALGIVPKNER